MSTSPLRFRKYSAEQHPAILLRGRPPERKPAHSRGRQICQQLAQRVAALAGTDSSDTSTNSRHRKMTASMRLGAAQEPRQPAVCLSLRLGSLDFCQCRCSTFCELGQQGHVLRSFGLVTVHFTPCTRQRPVKVAFHRPAYTCTLCRLADTACFELGSERLTERLNCLRSSRPSVSGIHP